MRVVVTETALMKLEEIFDILSLENPSYAGKWLTSTFDIIGRLKKYPYIGHLMEGVDPENIRVLLKGSYRIYYLIQKQTVYILTVRHVRQRLITRELVRARDIIVNEPPSKGLYIS